jgi:hypothetical protein
MNINIYLSKITTLVLYFFFDKNNKFLDFIDRYGIFTKLMINIGFDFYWSDKYSNNLASRGFEYNQNNKVYLIT